MKHAIEKSKIKYRLYF